MITAINLVNIHYNYNSNFFYYDENFFFNFILFLNFT